MKKIGIIILIILLVLVAGAAAISLMTGLDSTDDLVVVIDKQLYYDNATNLHFVKQHSIEVTNILYQPVQYSYKITPSKATTFTYTVDGKVHTFNDKLDMTKAFITTKTAKGFNLDCRNVTIESTLSKLHPGKAVVIPANTVMPSNSFVLTITNESKQSLSFTFTIYIGVAGLELNQSEVVL